MTFAPGTIGARLDAVAASMGDTPLLVAGSERRSATEVAAEVRARAVAAVTAPGDRVALRAAGDIDTLILLLGVAAAGRVAVPLDPREPPERLEALLTLADPALAVCAAPTGDGPWTAWPTPADATSPGAAVQPPSTGTVTPVT
ncbi:MAG: AMP-binding protein [Actinomycetota bacterium]